jgi:hypothetical protein
MTAAGRARPDWLFLLRPKWLCWHAFAVVATAGMLWLGDWQLHRALSGNELSWAYTFEWPLFAIFGLLFWARSLRDEVRLKTIGGDGGEPASSGDAGPAASPDAGDDAGAAEAHLARLHAEVQGHGKWHGWR